MSWSPLLRLIWVASLITFAAPSLAFSAIRMDSSISTDVVVEIAQQAVDMDFEELQSLSVQDRAVVVDYLHSLVSRGEFENIRTSYFEALRESMIDDLSEFKDGLLYSDPEVIRDLEVEISNSEGAIDGILASLSDPERVALDYAQRMAWVEAEYSVEPIADGCWTGKGTVHYYYIGVYAWTFESIVNWCGDGTYVTWHDGANSDGRTTLMGGYFYYPGDLQKTNSGTGDRMEWVQNRGHFAQCIAYKFGCWLQWWPYIRHNIWGHGPYSWYYGF